MLVVSEEFSASNVRLSDRFLRNGVQYLPEDSTLNSLGPLYSCVRGSRMNACTSWFSVCDCVILHHLVRITKFDTTGGHHSNAVKCQESAL